MASGIGNLFREGISAVEDDDHRPLPFGRGDLDINLKKHLTSSMNRCVVKGCDQWLRPPSRNPKYAGDVCPMHGIRVHSGRTYSYEDYRQNLIIDADWFDRHIRRHPFKYEANRFGQERSEDAVTWNVFRSFQRGGLLHRIAELCTGMKIAAEPRLYLWGLELRSDGVKPWDLLIKARERFESDLPVARPKTEPDIALFLPGQYLVLIEAKFTSPNGTYDRDTKTKLFDLTIDQFVRIYRDSSLRILDYDEVARRDSVFYQLHRNLTFSDFMALQDHPDTRAYHANLVRAIHEDKSCEAFLTCIKPAYQDRFERITWEQLYAIAGGNGLRLDRLCRYIEQKTEQLRPAFQIAPTASHLGNT
jgi:hypothetical protein